MPFGRRALGRARQRPGSQWSDAARMRYWWRAERELLLEALDRVPPQAERTPLADDAWSPSGIAAHRLFWEAEERSAFAELLGGSPPALLDLPTDQIDRTNASAVEALGDRRMTALLRVLLELRERSAALVEQISDDDLNQHGHPARLLLGVALEHDREHRQQLEAVFGELTTPPSARLEGS